MAHPGQEYNPDDMAFYYFEGLAHYMKKDNDKTLETFKKAVEQINKDSDPDIVTDLYSVMGDIYHAKGQDSLAFQSYEKSLQWKPDNVGALNNYAYYLSERNEDLEKAEQMSRKTIDAEPKNSTFLDTYAWILFQQGKYADAKTYIDQAIENDSTLGDVVLEHAGDIYYMSGEKEKALDFWTKAAEKGEAQRSPQQENKTEKDCNEMKKYKASYISEGLKAGRSGRNEGAASIPTMTRSLRLMARMGIAAVMTAATITLAACGSQKRSGIVGQARG